MKKATTIIASVLLVASIAGPAGAEGHMSKGTDTNGSRVQSYQNSNYMDRTNSNLNMNMDGNYRTNGDYRNNGDYRTNSVRTNAATTTDRDRGMDWGWLGLLGLLGLAGMRKRVTDHHER
ncbi:WGxxGxxG family protein [Paenibacillus sp. 2TAF8]|jgi:MYXO-CTERM domain-containing protein|uniref:WGxxGxxG family protein n=1 Tax=Paenibacillus sp. 2TAF8 TaxID=3233020 RepID=UPI003F9B3678